MRDITGYDLSRDYARLVELMRHQSIVCIVDYHSCRDVAQTLYDEYKGEETFQVSSRGMGFVHAEAKDNFIAQCERANLEYLPPMTPPNLTVTP